MAIHSEQIFELTEFHLKLLSQLTFGWDADGYDGAPAVNLKRPYGNSDVLGDLREIYAEASGAELIGNEIGEYSFLYADGDSVDAEDIEAQLWDAHRSMATVLEIVSHNASEGVSAGTYRRPDGYSSSPWKRQENS